MIYNPTMRCHMEEDGLLFESVSCHGYLIVLSLGVFLATVTTYLL